VRVRAVIVDDERLARNRLGRLLSEIDVDVVAEGANGQEAIELVQNHKVDVLFIDINMPKRDGISAAKYISEHLENPPSIVFCTAYDEFALDAFETNATAYLLKPVSREDLSRVIDKASRLNQMQLNALSEIQTKSSTVVVGEGASIESIDTKEITLFKIVDKHVYAVIDSRGEVLVNYTLKQLEEKLASDFVRVHRNSLVAKRAMSRIEKNESGVTYLFLTGEQAGVQVSRRHLSVVKQYFRK